MHHTVYYVYVFHVTENKRKVVIVKLLQSRGYPSDPVKKWKQSVSDEVEEEEVGEGEEEGKEREGEADYNYLLSMSLWSLTLEKKEELLKKRDEKVCFPYLPTSLPSSFHSLSSCSPFLCSTYLPPPFLSRHLS